MSNTVGALSPQQEKIPAARVGFMGEAARINGTFFTDRVFQVQQVSFVLNL